MWESHRSAKSNNHKTKGRADQRRVARRKQNGRKQQPASYFRSHGNLIVYFVLTRFHCTSRTVPEHSNATDSYSKSSVLLHAKTFPITIYARCRVVCAFVLLCYVMWQNEIIKKIKRHCEQEERVERFILSKHVLAYFLQFVFLSPLWQDPRLCFSSALHCIVLQGNNSNKELESVRGWSQALTTGK